MKFKIGNKVRIREWDDIKKEYGLNEDGSIKPPKEVSILSDMKEYCGKETIVALYDGEDYKLEIDGGVWFWPESALLSVKKQEEPVKKILKKKYLLANISNPECVLETIEKYVNTEESPNLDIVLAILGIFRNKK